MMQSRNGRSTADASEDPLGRLLHEEFSRETEAQRGQLPDPELIRTLARLNAGNRYRSWIARTGLYAEALAMSAITAVVAFWWIDAMQGLEALLPATLAGAPAKGGLGLVGGLLGASLYWVRSFFTGG